MTDTHAVSALRRKQEELQAAIRAYELKLDSARRELSHVNACIRLFQINGETPEFPIPMSVFRLFRRGEMFAACKTALADAPDGLDTRELSRLVIRSKGLDESDPVLRSSVAYSLVRMLQQQAKHGRIVAVGKRRGVSVWMLPAQ